MKAWRPAMIVLVVALLGAAAVVSAPERFLVQAPAARQQYPKYQGVRVIRDDFDHANFADRGLFLPEGKKPYVERYSEYPQLGTYLFAFPYLFVSTWEGYRAFFTFLMAAALGGIAMAMTPVCVRLGVAPYRVLLLLLPGTLYFSLNRFDAVPTALVMAALALVLAGRLALGHAVLAAAFLTKAYPLLYVPLFSRVAWDAGGARGVLRAWAAFAGTIAVCTAQIAAGVGFKPLLGPYLFFGNRLDNTQSLFHVVSQALPVALETPARAVFRVMQAGLGLAGAAVGRLSARDVVRWMAVMTIAFVVFTRFQSPQWVVWITPPALLAARDRTELALVAAQDVLTYLYFPLAYDRFGPIAPGLAFVVGALTAIRLVLLACLLRPDVARGPQAPA
jgi:hypothetical protein